jgi:molybdopterin-containing oxidoreductase family iron-sulfur binding subunit
MSKRIFQHPTEPASGRKYWRSLGQLQDTPEFRGWLEREFPQGASEMQGGEVSRRNFLQLMGASMALAGLSFSGCRRPEKHLVPFTRGVEWSIPGKPLFFTTARPTRRGYAPLVATTHDGRPTKMEGNPLHPVSKGATDMHSQSSLLDLYDPERATHFLDKGKEADSASFEKNLDAILAAAGDGAGLAFLLEKNNSPTRERLRGEILKRFPKALWAVYEPTGDELAEQAATAAFGEGVTAVPVIEAANVIMSLDCDFLGTEGDVDTVRQFSKRRKVTGPNSTDVMNRLYVIENRYTITGGIADHRLRVPASQIGAFALALAAEVGAVTSDATLAQTLKAFGAPAVKFNEKWVKISAADLIANKGKSLVLVGSRQPAAVQVLVAAINAALDNFGKTIIGRKATEKPAISIGELARNLTNDAVKTLFIVGGNPVYNAPADLNLGELLKKGVEKKSIENIIRLGASLDETSQFAQWNVPLAHYLESWGDGLASDGSYVSVQPMILPLFGGWSEIDLLAKVAGRPKPTGPELIQETFKAMAAPKDFVTAWSKFLHDGFLADSAAKAQTLAFNSGAAVTFVSDKSTLPALADNAYEVVFVSCAKVDDGRYNNNGWLQEIPDPITKLTWDNAALVSPATAKKLGVKGDDRNSSLIEITVGQQKMTAVAIVAPGHAEGSISIALGYGRSKVGRVGAGTGFNAYPLRTSAQPYFAVGATVKTTGDSYGLALTQEHWALEGRGADLTREQTVAEYKLDPDHAKTMGMDSHIPKNVSLYKNPPMNSPAHPEKMELDPHAWGMVVDLNSCIGCSACMVACQSENNIPIVGKEQVSNGREMHWIRTDRYFASMEGHEADPEMVSQPMMCQHCEYAPCETVCPVNATVHSEDGLNVMAYNRCIGTRYCANNCPFKVRRFNFFDYNQRDVQGRAKNPDDRELFTGLYEWNLTADKGTPDTIKLSKNPNVTVRMRGVMEKCTFCVQRIQEAKIAMKVSARDSGDIRIPANAFTTACAQACPAEAITFGDINNPDSAVSKLKKSERGYRLLEYLNVSTRVSYLARIRNPNPDKEMPGAENITAAVKSGGHH